MMLALVFLAALVTKRLPLVQWRLTDELAVASFALIGSASWLTVRSKKMMQESGLDVIKIFLFGALVLSSLSVAVLLAVNAVLDDGSPIGFVGVVARTSVFHGRTIWTVVGAPVVPTTNDTLILPDRGQANEGDTIVVEVRPGFLGRPWIASVKTHVKLRLRS
jgi:hypothetical protein